MVPFIPNMLQFFTKYGPVLPIMDKVEPNSVVI